MTNDNTTRAIKNIGYHPDDKKVLQEMYKLPAYVLFRWCDMLAIELDVSVEKAVQAMSSIFNELMEHDDDPQ